MSTLTLNDYLAPQKLDRAIKKNALRLKKRGELTKLPPKGKNSSNKLEKISKFQYILDKDEEAVMKVKMGHSRNRKISQTNLKLASLSKIDMRRKSRMKSSFGTLPSLQKRKMSRSFARNSTTQVIPMLSNFQDLFQINNSPFKFKNENENTRNKLSSGMNSMTLKSDFLGEKCASPPILPMYKEKLVNQFSPLKIKEEKKNFFNFSDVSLMSNNTSLPSLSNDSGKPFKKLRIVPFKKTTSAFGNKIIKNKKASKIIKFRKRLMSNEGSQESPYPVCSEGSLAQ
ncbi:unnamed protein product [Moneuplotes crassus]|uniref:Uncharacterized protein n=1 Tax=Euplotes crassus TaxID=5936 RepID=A0AAD1UF77_EUPCR|nr:unnamed protein product [Moneuplotes crassus]